MVKTASTKASGYDKFVNWKLFAIPLILCILAMAIPTPSSMKDVATEYKVGPKAVVDMITRELFQASSADAAQWQHLGGRHHGSQHEHGRHGQEKFPERECPVAATKQNRRRGQESR